MAPHGRARGGDDDASFMISPGLRYGNKILCRGFAEITGDDEFLSSVAGGSGRRRFPVAVFEDGEDFVETDLIGPAQRSLG